MGLVLNAMLAFQRVARLVELMGMWMVGFWGGPLVGHLAALWEQRKDVLEAVMWVYVRGERMDILSAVLKDMTMAVKMESV